MLVVLKCIERAISLIDLLALFLIGTGSKADLLCSKMLKLKGRVDLQVRTSKLGGIS